MNFPSFIEQKKLGRALTDQQIRYFVRGAADGSVPDYQLAAMLMAIRLNGMTEDETTALTLAMAGSGDMLDPDVGGIAVDKHSTGGVGDTTTLVLVPSWLIWAAPWFSSWISPAVRIMASGLNLPSQLTMMAVKPWPPADSVVTDWSSPAPIRYPARPHSAPLSTMVRMITLPTLIPTYLAVRTLSPTTLISYPCLV